ncbi:hypothetical protein ACFQY5_10135 [Paeniroseomonas aquatica]|uniref:hypothetical protein n=1 Tax=Paeniroseomonas aquatica TaxID=373043 RepID=UPI00361922FC
MRRVLRAAMLAGTALGWPLLAWGQGLDLSQGGPVDVTASDGIEWRQAEQVVIARGNARAVRGGVTVDSDRLMARYRPQARAGAAPAPPPPPARRRRRTRRSAAAARSGGWRRRAASASPPPPTSPAATARSMTSTRRCWC